jgi:hypothetical protein
MVQPRRRQPPKNGPLGALNRIAKNVSFPRAGAAASQVASEMTLLANSEQHELELMNHLTRRFAADNLSLPPTRGPSSASASFDKLKLAQTRGTPQ